MPRTEEVVDFLHEIAPLIIAVLAYLKSERASRRSKRAMLHCTRADCPLKPENQIDATEGK